MKPFLSFLACLPLSGALLLSACSSAQEPVSLYESGEELPGGSGTNTLLFGQHAFSREVDNITVENSLLFFGGNGFFNQPWVTAPASTEARDGLGPLFNARSCSGCHFRDGRGRPPLEEGEELSSLLFRLSVGEDENEMPVGDERYGGQFQPFSVSGVEVEAKIVIAYEEEEGSYPDGTSYSLLVPSYSLKDLAYGELDPDVVMSPRVAPAMHGLGLLEAISEERLSELADEDDADGDGISGRIRRVPQAGVEELGVGRFGWKAEQPSVRQQSAGAFLGDMGLTTSLFPAGECTSVQEVCLEQPSGGEPEISDEILLRVERYGQLLAVPARGAAEEPEVLEGKGLFVELGCASCHTQKHVTGEHELSELSGQTIFPYTDLLLHDMGEALADGSGETRVQREWRTPPLWGIRFFQAVNDHERLLHDGRARGVEEAILWHGGEGEAAKEAFKMLSADERQSVIEFVGSL